MTNRKATKSPLWITWEKQVRNRSMSRQLGARLVEIQITGNHFKRYMASTALSFCYLWRWRSSVVFVQNPSLVLSLQAVLLKFFLKYKLIIDAHNAGIYPKEGANKLLQWLADRVNVSADLILVTNEGLADRIRRLGGNVLVMPDPLPDIQVGPSGEAQSSNGIAVALFICTWAADEPYFEVFGAAEILPHVRFLVTGNSKGRELAYKKALPSNVVLTGYIPDQEYEQVLRTCDLVIDLTTRDDCLVCGAYEAVSVERPFILSDSDALRSYFRMGGVHVSNRAEAIAAGVRCVLENYDEYLSDVAQLKQMLAIEWLESRAELAVFLRE